ncbi:GNAT family N-acetyltransferase [Hwanghaeella grinnelliae]|uniref:GNAT family N-acetyltransferase n=1 Tax=Hwanghaeella grinnelliae TaxID=2500179 RepID=UPI001387489D|nr:GNAT family N-acetyltransferase [Hwanghaeella grinnelliae]
MRDTTKDLLIAIAGGAFDQHERVLEILKSAFAGQDGIVDPPSSVTRLTVEGVIRDAEAGDLLTAETRKDPAPPGETSEGDIVGCLFTKVEEDADGPLLYAYHLAVDPAYQGHGIGHRLFDTVTALAAARQIRRLQIMSRIELKELHAFFTGMGFRQVGTFTHDGYEQPTSLRFEKQL